MHFQFKRVLQELEIQLEREHQDYEDLTAKYDMLEEDYLVIKAKLVLEKESIQRLLLLLFCYFKSIVNILCRYREYLSLKKEYDTIENELRALRETFNLRQDTWIKEKLDMQVSNSLDWKFARLKIYLLKHSPTGTR